MYCPTCGVEVPGELNYCNRCGANLNAATNVPAPAVAPVSFNKLALIIGFVLVVGLGIVFAAGGEMMRKGVGEKGVIWLIMLGLATLFGVSAMLIRLWSQVSGLSSQRQPQPKRQQTSYEPPRAAQLPPRPASFGSVTENTTRTFDPVLRDSVEQQK